MSVTINITKAKEVSKELLRIERKPVLESLDVQFQRAMEQNQSTSAIVTKKQELRDITDHDSIVNAETVEELKSALDTLIEGIKAQ